MATEEDLRAMRIGREADDAAWRKLWEKEKARAEEAIDALMAVLRTQPMGHQRVYAINGKCLCRWCRAHRLVSDERWAGLHKSEGSK